MFKSCIITLQKEYKKYKRSGSVKEVEVIKARNDLQTRTRGKTIELMRVGAYCRVSTDSADQLNSYKS